MTTTLPAGWKPIESAPRDGTPVLLFARHINAEASTRVVGAYHYDYGWLSQAYSGQGMAQLVASHWMELPPFPYTPPATPQDAPITVSLDPDPRGVSVGVWQGSHCIYNGAHAVPSAQDDAKDERQAFEAWAKKKKMPLARIGQQYDDFWVDHAWNGWQARAALAAPAAGDARAEPAPEWAACESRRPWVTNSLRAKAQELREKEKRCRTAFNKDFMGMPSRYVADAYAEAAAVFEARLAAIAASQQQEG
ncbi:hypothetical protein IB259_00110 [Achromobacter sp. ACM04]|uniref:hypothetical protein n=1 Tax=Achromobacter sp. ACM04 TaxID=2769312 RepID=UPI001783D414|nr:hypothetical protein [Achromobacter sp. ACM04]MBD9417622.1 hypothetical protein [Achromobacter sp. ACM04]